MHLIKINMSRIIPNSKTKNTSKLKHTSNLRLLKTRVSHKFKINQNNKQNTIKALKNKQERTLLVMKENRLFPIRKRMMVELQMLIVMEDMNVKGGKTKISMIIMLLTRNKRVTNILIRYRNSLKRITFIMGAKCRLKKIKLKFRKF